MSKIPEAQGSCLCGAVKFTAKDLDPHYHACHCSMCRNWAGGPALAIGVGSVDFEDESAIKRYQSSDWAERAFCTGCGTNLFYHLLPADMYIVWSGTFEDQSQFELAGEIYIDEKPAHYNFVGDHPRLTGEEFMAQMNPEA